MNSSERQPKPVSAAEFYENFKHALASVGLQWGDMDLAEVTVVDSMVIMTYRGHRYTFDYGAL